MEALKHLHANIPDWLKRLEDLDGQIEQRQQDLAHLTESQSASCRAAGAAKSLKNKGSTESLKPRDEPEAHAHDPTPQPETPPQQNHAQPPLEPAAAPEAPPPASPAGSNTPSALQRQISQVKAAGQARVRATMRKRHRTDSVVSAEGAAPKYRTRSMIIVYYDSYVQSFFEELVKFVSASRNMMRKAKMAAKVAHIKRMAELETPDDDEEDQEDAAAASGATTGTPAVIAADTALEAGSSKDGEEDMPVLPYISTQRMRPSSRTPGGAGRPAYTRAFRSSFRGIMSPGMDGPPQPDVYDDLDKGLEYVQSMCEHAAHQFLRDGDCSEEVANIRRRLGETKEAADKEIERVKKEDPAALDAPPEDVLLGRSYRPQIMRREIAGGLPGKDVATELEVDEGIEDMDEDNYEPPKLIYKSTRLMRR